MDLILTFDVGTTAIKSTLFDRNLSPLASQTDEYRFLDLPGLVEIEPEVYWDTLCGAVQAFSVQFDLSAVCAVCLTTQGETLIPVDEAGGVLHNALVWLDSRAQVQAARICAKIDEDALYAATGVGEMNGAVPLAKLLWFREEHPEIYQKTYKFLLLEDFLLHRLTGRFVTERSLLTSTAYFDLRTDEYWHEALDVLDLDENKLPEILDCGAKVGTIRPETARVLGLTDQVCVLAGAMDQVAAGLGGGLQPGAVTATVGTAMVMTSLMPSGAPLPEIRLPVYRGAGRGERLLLNQGSTAGAVFTWFKERFCREEAARCAVSGGNVYDRLCAEASEVSPGANGVTLLPYFAGCIQPYAAADAKGAFLGLTLTTTRAELTRAVLESVGYMLRENLDILRELGIQVHQMTFFGGGSKNARWNQILADITGVELLLLEQSECGSVGAAMLAAVRLGWYENLEQAQLQNPVRARILPDETKVAAYDASYERYKRLMAALMPLYQ